MTFDPIVGARSGGWAFFLAKNLRWLGAGFLLCFFSSFGQTFFISLSGGAIRGELGLSNGTFGLLYMLATLASAATLPIVGRVLDRFATRMVAAGTILCLALATALLAHATAVWMLVLAFYLLRLFGQGMMLQTAFTATGRWFSAQRGRAVSVVSLGNQAGEAVLPLLFVLGVGLVGWRTSWLVATALLVVLALPVIAALTGRERDPLSEPPNPRHAALRHWTLHEVLRDPVFYPVCLATLAAPFIVSAVLFHQSYLGELRGWPPALFATGFTVMSAVTVASTLLGGWIVDRFTARRILPLFLVPLMMGCLVLAWFESEAALFGFMVLVGLSNGLSSTLLGALWPELYGTRHLGAIRSLVFPVFVLASAVGPGMTGLLLDRGVSYPAQLVAMAAYCAAAVAVMALIAPAMTRRARGS
ncbi:MFS transporter [Aureimonas sp. AU12]|uniref:MFS transporter n=1 Tax=Aureimonas sp. AU12 TaxID=1638161 RepID=UPI000A65E911|nr:MFS transporter [Aureimonas sp. AU12]